MLPLWISSAEQERAVELIEPALALPEIKKLQMSTSWMVGRNFPGILEIEELCFEKPWTEQDFRSCLRGRTNIGEVVEIEDKVVGFWIQQLQREAVQLLTFAVHPDFRRTGVGKFMVEKIKTRLSLQRKGRTKLWMMLRESNLGAQLFFQKQKCKATQIVRNYYDDTRESAYKFEFNLPDTMTVEDILSSNRLTTYFNELESAA